MSISPLVNQLTCHFMIYQSKVRVRTTVDLLSRANEFDEILVASKWLQKMGSRSGLPLLTVTVIYLRPWTQVYVIPRFLGR